MKNPKLASAPEVARYYEIHPFILTRWVRRGCPVLRQNPYILDIDQVEKWRIQRGMEPVVSDN